MTVADTQSITEPDSEQTTHPNRTAAVVLEAAAVLLLVPVALYFWYIHRYGVNAIYTDQWNDVALLTHTPYFTNSYSGHTTVRMLWIQHAENRTFFPNTVVLVLGRFTHLNVVTELYLNAVLLLVSLVLIVRAHRRDVPQARLVLYLPAAFLVFTLGQSENTLFGYQLWLYMVIAALATVIFLLARRRSNWSILAVAIAVAVIGSYSALDGFAIWPAGLVVLLWRHRSRAFVYTWLIAAVGTASLWLYHYDFSAGTAGGTNNGNVLAHPFAAAEFFFLLLGDPMGTSIKLGGSISNLVEIGIAIFVLSLACLAVYARRGKLARSPVGPALICFGLVIAVLVTIGRTHLGLWAASQSRYVTEDLLVLLGCYLCLLERWPARDRETVSASLATTALAFDHADRFEQALPERWRQRVLVALRFLAVSLIVVEVAGGMENGIGGGAGTRQMYQLDNLVAAHAAKAPDSLIKSALFPNDTFQYSNVRQIAEAAKRDRLSFFATSEAAVLERTGLPKVEVRPLRTTVVRPVDGARIHGNALFIAGATSDYPINSVRFQITSSSGQPVALIHATRFLFGFLGGWGTTKVPNGTYVVRSTAKDVEGRSRSSEAVSITVDN